MPVAVRDHRTTVNRKLALPTGRKQRLPTTSAQQRGASIADAPRSSNPEACRSAGAALRHRSRRRRCHQGPAGDSGSARVRRSSSPSSRSTITRRSARARGGSAIKALSSVSRAETTSQHGQSAHGRYSTLPGVLRNRPRATIASKTAPDHRLSASSRATVACEPRARPSICSGRRSRLRERRARTVLGGLRGIAPSDRHACSLPRVSNQVDPILPVMTGRQDRLLVLSTIK